MSKSGFPFFDSFIYEGVSVYKHFEDVPLEARKTFRPVEAWVIIWIGTSGLHVACPALFALGIFPASPDEYAFVGFFVLEFGDRDSAFPVDDGGITDM